MGIRKWNMPKPNPIEVKNLVEESGLPLAVAQVLAGRGQEALNDEGSAMHNPFLMKDMEKAVQRILAAVEEGEMVAVYGDYDCDGINATFMMYNYLQNMGACVMYYIPDRDEEGYGMNISAVDKLDEMGVNLIITVDNGISAIEEVDYANQKGIDVVVTDHHKPREAIPAAVAVLNPHREDCSYPFKNLCGAGVAFKLICALEGDASGEETSFHYGEFAAIATVADVVELTGENRAIVKAGLESLKNTDNLGLRALLKVSGITEGKLDSISLAFALAPRLNAAGRMGQAGKAVDLLLCEDEEEATALAEELDDYNKRRKELVVDILKEIDEKILKSPELAQQRLLVLCGRGWHHGVIGIAASKMVERYSKPCILISTGDTESRASARSVEGYSIIDAIFRCRSLLTRFGGHSQAAGLSLKPEDVDSFTKELLEDARENFDIMPVDALNIDAVIPIEALALETAKQYLGMEPFGCGNAMPVAAILGCALEGITPMGGGKHLRLRFSNGGKVLQAVYFGMTESAFPYKQGDILDLAANLDLNEYRGEVSLSVKLRDARLSGIKQEKLVVGKQYYEKYCRGEKLEIKILNYIRPQREDVAALYRFLREHGGFCDGYDILWCRLKSLNYCKLRLCVAVMEELGLILLNNTAEPGQEATISLPAVVKKADLESSDILKRLKAGEEECIHSTIY